MSQFDDLQAFLAHARSTNTGSAGRALAAAPVLSLDEMRARQTEQRSACWGLTAMRGRLVEISGRGATAVLTTAAGIVVDAQTAGEPVVWVTLAHSHFFHRISLQAGWISPRWWWCALRIGLPRCVQPSACCAQVPLGWWLLISVLQVLSQSQLNQSNQPNQMAGAAATATHARLITLAQQHDAAVVCLTEKPPKQPRWVRWFRCAPKPCANQRQREAII